MRKPRSQSRKTAVSKKTDQPGEMRWGEKYHCPQMAKPFMFWGGRLVAMTLFAPLVPLWFISFTTEQLKLIATLLRKWPDQYPRGLTDRSPCYSLWIWPYELISLFAWTLWRTATLWSGQHLGQLFSVLLFSHFNWNCSEISSEYDCVGLFFLNCVWPVAMLIIHIICSLKKRRMTSIFYINLSDLFSLKMHCRNCTLKDKTRWFSVIIRTIIWKFFVDGVLWQLFEMHCDVLEASWLRKLLHSLFGPLNHLRRPESKRGSKYFFFCIFSIIQ